MNDYALHFNLKYLIHWFENNLLSANKNQTNRKIHESNNDFDIPMTELL